MRIRIGILATVVGLVIIAVVAMLVLSDDAGKLVAIGCVAAIGPLGPALVERG